jgi:hypothetical protein
MLAVNLVAVYRYSPRSIPVSDELQQLGGGADLTPAWLWEQHAEHRIPLPKLIWMGVLRLTNYDFRIGNIIEVLAVGAVALLLIRTASRLRGGPSLSDAFFPLVLLNFGQTTPVFLWWWQINHTLPPLLACVLLAIIVKEPPLRLRHLALAGILLVLLALSGPGGLPYALWMSLWLGYRGFQEIRQGDERRQRNGLFVLGLAAVAIIITGLYFVGFERSDKLPPPAELNAEGLRATGRTALQVLSLSVGTETQPYWKVWGTAVAILWIATMAFLLVMLRQDSEQSRACRLLMFMAGACSLILVLSWARANYGDLNNFEGHYLTKGVPGLCCVYFTWLIYGRRPFDRLMPLLLFAMAAVACALLVIDWSTYKQHAYDRWEAAHDFDRDLRAGETPELLYERYKAFHGVAGEDPALVQGWFRHLRNMNIGPFRYLPAQKFASEIAQPLAQDMVRKGDLWEATSDDPRLIFLLDKPRHVDAIRLTFAYGANTDVPALLQVFWRLGDQPFDETRRFTAQLKEETTVRTISVPVNATIDSFRIDPNHRRSSFRLLEIKLDP